MGKKKGQLNTKLTLPVLETPLLGALVTLAPLLDPPPARLDEELFKPLPLLPPGKEPFNETSFFEAILLSTYRFFTRTLSISTSDNRPRRRRNYAKCS